MLTFWNAGSFRRYLIPYNSISLGSFVHLDQWIQHQVPSFLVLSSASLIRAARKTVDGNVARGALVAYDDLMTFVEKLDGSYSPVWWRQRSFAEALASAAAGVIVRDGDGKLLQVA